MMTMRTILNHLTGNEGIESLLQTMTDSFDDFADVQQQYINVMHTLQQELGGNAVPAVEEEMEAIQQQITSTLLFSGLLGFKANWDHFLDPAGKTFLDTESEVYLCEHLAYQLPKYASAQKMRAQFFLLLSPQQQEMYEAVSAYVGYLEAVGPKLAHYYGYLLGNEILPWVVPGYHIDSKLTLQYQRMLEAYLDISLR